MRCLPLRTMTDHPINLPGKLWDQWIADSCDGYLAAREAARWGADRELKACLEWIGGEDLGGFARQLREARRPASLKEKALDSFRFIGTAHALTGPDWDNIRRALESLDD